MTRTVITGSSRGIGLELVKQCVARGDEVVALCRRSGDDLAGTGARVEEGIDVADDGVGKLLNARLGDLPIDILINNAGILGRTSLDDLDLPSVRAQFEVNSLGPLRVTHALLANLKSGSKVAIVTSRMGSIADNTSGGHYGYRMSKAAVNMIGRSLALDLKPRGIAVMLLHPGFVKTAMTGGGGMIEASESAQGLLARIEELEMATTGTFRHANSEPLPW